MTIIGSTNADGWTYKLEATETSTSVVDRTSTVQVKAYIGRANSTSWIAGTWTGNITVAGRVEQISGTLAYQTWINGNDWHELATKTFTVSNTDNPTTISISSVFTPQSGVTPSYASASGTMQLTILHLNPDIGTATMTETNTTMINLGVPNTTVVRYLSKKTITLSATAYDSATLKYRLKHYNTDYAIPSNTTFQNSATFNTDYTENDITITDGKANIIQDVGDSLNGLTSDWVQLDIGGVIQKPNAIAYTKPLLVSTATTIKRKSGEYSPTLGRVANLTDGIVSINISGSIYKENDIIGNHNTVAFIGYKIWEKNTAEPGSYTSLTPTISGSNVTVSNVEASGVLFTKVYNYKIILTDNCTPDGEVYYHTTITGTIPLGQPTWAEYKDRVDFLKLTVKGYNPFEYSTNETICGIWNDGYNETYIYRKVLGSLGTISTTGSKTFSVSSLSINNLLKIDGTINYLTDYVAPLSRITPYYNTDNEEIIIYNDKSYAIDDGFVYIEYTKT